MNDNLIYNYKRDIKDYIGPVIKTVLNNTDLENWLDYGPMLAGGHFRAYCYSALNKTDIDLFFPDHQKACLADNVFYDRCKHKTESKSGYANRYYLIDGRKFNIVITRWATTVPDLVSDFDYAHTLCGYDFKEDKFYANQLCLNAITKNSLIINDLNNLMTRKPNIIERRYCKMVFDKGMTPKFYKMDINISKTDQELKSEYGY